MKGPFAWNSYSNPHYYPSLKAQDFKIKFLVYCDTRSYKFLINYLARNEKYDNIFYIFECAGEASSSLPYHCMPLS
jgi:hypothetical protein